MAGNREERPGGRLRARTRQSDRMAGEEEEDPVLRAGRFSSRAGVLGRDTEDGVSSLLDLRRQADEVSRRAGGMRKSVVDAKVAMVAQRLAFERRLQVGEQDGADPVTKARSSHAWAEIPTDHLKFGKLVKGRNEVDEEVLALRREIVEGEREYRSLIVQKSKLDRMAAAFTSSRVIQELSSKELSYNMTDDMKKLLKSTNRLRSQISMQGEAAPGLKVPHLSSYGSPTAAGPRGSSNSSAVNRQNNERLELSLLRDKVQTLESKISEFENNMSLASILDDSEVKRIVDDYLLEEHSISYQLEVRTGSHEKSQTDCEVYVSLAGTMGFSEREMLFNPHYGQTSFEKGSVRYFIIRTSKDLGELQNMTVWIGSVGDKPSWFLEDIIVYNLKTGTSYMFECGWLIQQQAELTAQLIANQLTMYDVVFFTKKRRSEASDDGKEKTTPLFPDEIRMSLLIKSNKSNKRDERSKALNRIDLVLNKQLMYNSRKQQEEENRLEFRVRAEYLGKIGGVELASFSPDFEWFLSDIHVSCHKDFDRQHFVCNEALSNKSRVLSEHNFCFRSLQREPKSKVEAEMQGLKNLIDGIPSFRMPVVVEEAIFDMLHHNLRRHRQLRAAIKLHVESLMNHIEKTLQFKLSKGDLVVAHFYVGNAKSEYAQECTVLEDSIGGEEEEEAEEEEGKEEEGKRKGGVKIEVGGIQQRVPSSWIRRVVSMPPEGSGEVAAEASKFFQPLLKKIDNLLLKLRNAAPAPVLPPAAGAGAGAGAVLLSRDQDYHLKAAYEHQQVSSQASPTAAVDVQVKELRLKNEKLLETEKMMEHYVDSLHEQIKQEEKLREHLNQEVEQLTRKVEQEEKLREEEERRREEVERERDQLAMKLAEVKRESERLKSGDDTSTGRAEIGQHAKENKVLSSSIQEELDTLRSENAKLLKEMQNLNYLLDLSQNERKKQDDEMSMLKQQVEFALQVKTEGDKIHQIEMRNEQLEKKLQDTIQELESLKLISKENQKLAEKMINSPKEDKSPDPRCWS